MTSPLLGRCVVITRPRRRATSWVQAFEADGARAIALPLFRLDLPAGEARESALAGIRDAVARGAWLAIASVSAAENLAELLDSAGVAGEAKSELPVACVGSATAERANALGFSVRVVGDPPDARGLAAKLLEHDATPDLAHVTSSKGRGELEAIVEGAGGRASTIVVSVHQADPDFDPRALESLLADGVDLWTFASPSAVDALLHGVSASIAERVRAVPALAVGPTTAQRLSEAAFSVVWESPSPRVEDVIDCARRGFSEAPPHG